MKNKKPKIFPFKEFFPPKEKNFFQITVKNLEICSIAETDFATDGRELFEIVKALRVKYPAPAYIVVVQPLESVGA